MRTQKPQIGSGEGPRTSKNKKRRGGEDAMTSWLGKNFWWLPLVLLLLCRPTACAASSPWPLGPPVSCDGRLDEPWLLNPSGIHFADHTGLLGKESNSDAVTSWDHFVSVLGWHVVGLVPWITSLACLLDIQAWFKTLMSHVLACRPHKRPARCRLMGRHRFRQVRHGWRHRFRLRMRLRSFAKRRVVAPDPGVIVPVDSFMAVGLNHRLRGGASKMLRNGAKVNLRCLLLFLTFSKNLVQVLVRINLLLLNLTLLVLLSGWSLVLREIL